MRTGPLLASDLVDKYQPLGAFGQPVYLSYVQLRAAIRQKLGGRHANYFARPDRDPQNKSIHWISEVAGTAVRWSDLSDEEQTRQAIELHAMRSDFDRYLKELRQQGSDASAEGKGAAAFASLLEQAMLVPDDGHLHFIGDQPVVSFWGFRNFDGQSFDPLTAAPRRTDAAAAVAAAPESVATQGGRAQGVGLPSQQTRRARWWRWLLWALALLLLLLLLLFALAWCATERGIQIPTPLPGTLPQTGEPSVPGQPRPEEEGGIIDRTLRYLGLESGEPGGEVIRPGGEIVTPAEPVPGTEKTLPGETIPPGAEGTEPGDSVVPKPEQPLLPVTPEGEPPASEPAKPDPPLPDQQGLAPKEEQPVIPEPGKPPLPQPEERSQPPQPQTPPPTPREEPGAKGQPLQIPPDAGKAGSGVGFVGGEWRSQSGLVDQTTKQPLQQSYRFDDKGKGEVVIRRADGVECRAPAQATMRGGKLGINELGPPTCPDGRTFSPSQTECTRTPSGQTVCQGRNADGSTYRVGIQRQ